MRLAGDKVNSSSRLSVEVHGHSICRGIDGNDDPLILEDPLEN